MEHATQGEFKLYFEVTLIVCTLMYTKVPNNRGV